MATPVPLRALVQNVARTVSRAVPGTAQAGASPVRVERDRTER